MTLTSGFVLVLHFANGRWMSFACKKQIKFICRSIIRSLWACSSYVRWVFLASMGALGGILVMKDKRIEYSGTTQWLVSSRMWMTVLIGYLWQGFKFHTIPVLRPILVPFSFVQKKYQPYWPIPADILDTGENQSISQNLVLLKIL